MVMTVVDGVRARLEQPTEYRHAREEEAELGCHPGQTDDEHCGHHGKPDTVAGATHASLYGAQYIEAIAQRDQSILLPDGQPKTFFQWIDFNHACAKLPPFTTVDVGLVYNKAIDSVRNWIERGTPAAPSRSFTISTTSTPPGLPVRDADGKVEGGIRLPQFVVPTADQGALNGPAFPCNVSGWHRYYTKDELKAMYGTHGRYVAKVLAVMYPLVTEGYVLRTDALAAVRDAALSDVAR